MKGTNNVIVCDNCRDMSKKAFHVTLRLFPQGGEKFQPLDLCDGCEKIFHKEIGNLINRFKTHTGAHTKGTPNHDSSNEDSNAGAAKEGSISPYKGPGTVSRLHPSLSRLRSTEGGGQRTSETKGTSLGGKPGTSR